VRGGGGGGGEGWGGVDESQGCVVKKRGNIMWGGQMEGVLYW